MHVRDLVELAATIAANGGALARARRAITDDGLAQYWTASKSRNDRWMYAIKRFSTRQSTGEASPAQWCSIRSVLEEILVSEVLTRTWTAVCCACDAERQEEELGPVVRNVLATHLEARNRALGIMVYGHGMRVEEATSLNRLRRRNEKWTDMLLGRLVPEFDVIEFAFNVNRARDFASGPRNASQADVGWSLLLASLRSAYQRSELQAAANPDLNRRIAASILHGLPDELFDSTGLTTSLWLQRIQDGASDTQGMIDELLQLDGALPVASDQQQLRRSGVDPSLGR